MAENLTITGHGYVTGDGPYQVTTTGNVPTGLALLSNYWIIVVDDDTIRLASSYDNAVAGIAVVMVDDGSGVHTLAGMPSAEQPAASVIDGYGAARIAAGVRRVLPAPSSMTFRGYDNASVLTYYWV